MVDIKRFEDGSVTMVIYGEPASKANSRINVVIKGVRRFIKSKKAQNYAKGFLDQCPEIKPLMSGDLEARITIHYASRRPDLDESLILDLLQGRIYENDRQVKRKVIEWGLDRDSPRAEITILPMA